ncbi:hypothetical protein BEK98_44190 [Streptomyces diastatochromogenes]|uniref:Alcohol dehydrogenase-like C-terminal domain-containing protein n=1 Tax=Streptomyces diastatochromogenes TaxID=42236 RepID=A0A233RUS3_STRDA|nr:hypothetical protein BEK98_44190 [Streptomyces diastatochromogenes]
MVLGVAPDPVEAQTTELILGSRTIQGHLTGTPAENEDNLAFSAANGIRPHIEFFPLSEAPRAYEHMLDGRARFRAVLDAADASPGEPHRSGDRHHGTSRHGHPHPRPTHHPLPVPYHSLEPE